MSDTVTWPHRMLSGAAKVFTAGALTGAAATAFGLISARQFSIRTLEIPILPPGHQPLRILHIGDMHVVTGDRRKIEFVRSLADLKPDLVINTGDNPGGANAIDDVVAALEPLLEIPGVIVPGSNDLYGPRAANPLRYLRAPSNLDDSESQQERIDTRALFDRLLAPGGWHLIANRALNMSIRDDLLLRFAGTHDAHMHADVWPGFHPAAVAADALATNAAELRVAVTHAPYRRVLDAAVADGADLVFAGHTHGGQVALPAYGAIVSNCDLPTGLASGLFPWRAAGRTGLVHVTAGIGASPTVPLRTFCTPEVSLMELMAAQPGSQH